MTVASQNEPIAASSPNAMRRGGTPPPSRPPDSHPQAPRSPRAAAAARGLRRRHPARRPGRRRRSQTVVIATPIYKAAYSGLLKIFLDLLPQDGLAGKSIWTLATGGSLAHLLALDYGLLPVLSALGARSHIDGVYAADAHIAKNPAGDYQVADDILRRLSSGAAQVLDRSPRSAPVTPPALVL
ncbi:NADPH-dependent FMN reductase domain-containing protein [Ditylenchus destructor]|nr:NADPH-dependent FMN reductase domain-containing protein [Ditylenchus destructor]